MNTNNRENEIAVITGTGTIKYIELEGGFFGIITDDGKRLLPLNLPDELKQNGQKVTFTAKRAQVMTIQMWGIPIEIVEIKRA